MKDHPTVCPRDRQLAPLTLGLGVVLWAGALALIAPHLTVAVVVGAAGIGALVIAVLFLGYFFAHGGLVAHLRGQGIAIGPDQLPDLHRQFEACCTTLGVDRPPDFYLLNGNGVLNAFATWFLGHRHVILHSDLVDAMEGNPAGVRFYIGHELGHVLRHDAPWVALLRWPALRLPIVGAAFARARESSCDLHGLACCPDRESAARSLAALAAGQRQWAALSMDGARRQAAEGRGFFLAFLELTGSYPWTAKRVVRVLDEAPDLPPRHPLAWLFAAVVPYAGRLSPGLSLFLYAYVIGMVAAIAIPSYQAYAVRARLERAHAATTPQLQRLTDYYRRTHAVPATLDQAGVTESADLADATAGPLHLTYTLDPRTMTLQVHVGAQGLQYVPSARGDGTIHWACGGLDRMPTQQVPPTCTP